MAFKICIWMKLAVRTQVGSMSYCETHTFIYGDYFSVYLMVFFLPIFSYIINREILPQKIRFVLPI